MLQAKPGAFARLGQGGAEGGCFLHNSTYDFNDAVIPLGAGYLAALAETAMPLARDDRMRRRMDPARATSRARYAEARDKFLAAARRARPRRSTRTCIRSRAARRARSWRWTSRCWATRRRRRMLRADRRATHGVEGFCGSGCQVGLLHDDEFVAAVRASGVAVVFVHALNPYGFSHLRRTNEDNVDLNRNFRDFATPPPANAAYAEVHGFMRAGDVAAVAGERGAIGAYVARAWRSARCRRRSRGGQCEFPDGLFYGGVRAGLEQRDAARGAARARRRAAGARLDRFPHGPRSARPWREDLRGPRRRRPTSRARRRGGATTSRRSTTARRRRRR